MSENKYENRLSTGSGSRSIEIRLNVDNRGIIIIKSNWMGRGQEHYSLEGKVEYISPTYGWIVIDTVKNLLESDDPLIHPTLEDGSIIYEFYLLQNLPHREHPHDLELMKSMGYANWNEIFDMLVIVQTSTTGILYSLIEEEDIYSDEPLHADDAEKIANLLLLIDKCKFQKVADD